MQSAQEVADYMRSHPGCTMISIKEAWERKIIPDARSFEIITGFERIDGEPWALVIDAEGKSVEYLSSIGIAKVNRLLKEG